MVHTWQVWACGVFVSVHWVGHRSLRLELAWPTGRGRQRQTWRIRERDVRDTHRRRERHDVKQPTSQLTHQTRRQRRQRHKWTEGETERLVDSVSVSFWSEPQSDGERKRQIHRQTQTETDGHIQTYTERVQAEPDADTHRHAHGL